MTPDERLQERVTKYGMLVLEVMSGTGCTPDAAAQIVKLAVEAERHEGMMAYAEPMMSALKATLAH